MQFRNDINVCRGLAKDPFSEDKLPPIELQHFSETAVQNILRRQREGVDISEAEGDVLTRQAALDEQVQEQGDTDEARRMLEDLYNDLSIPIPDDTHRMELAELTKQIEGLQNMLDARLAGQ